MKTPVDLQDAIAGRAVISKAPITYEDFGALGEHALPFDGTDRDAFP